MDEEKPEPTIPAPPSPQAMSEREILEELLTWKRLTEVQLGRMDRELAQVGKLAQEIAKAIEDVPSKAAGAVAEAVVKVVTRIEALEDHKRKHDFYCDRMPASNR